MSNKILDENFLEKISTEDNVFYTIAEFAGIVFGALGSYFLMNRILTSPSLNANDIFYTVAFLALLLFCFFRLVNDKKYIFTPHFIIIKSRFLGKKRLDNIIGFEPHREIHTENNEETITDIIILTYANGSIKLDSNSIGNFYTIKKFIEKHYDFIPLDQGNTDK